MTYIPNNDFFLEVSKGNVSKHLRLNKSGFNADIDVASGEDIWDGGGNWVAPTTDRIHAIVSSSVNDTSAGTGARTLSIRGISSGNITIETITLNGTTPVNTVNSYSIIDYMYILTAGPGETNSGIITATAAVDATVTAQINVNGTNQTQMAITQVPNGYKYYISDWDCEMYQATATSTADIYFQTKSPGGVWLTRRISYLSNSGNSSKEDIFKPQIQILEGSYVKIRCESVSSNNTKVEGYFNGILVQN